MTIDEIKDRCQRQAHPHIQPYAEALNRAIEALQLIDDIEAEFALAEIEKIFER